MEKKRNKVWLASIMILFVVVILGVFTGWFGGIGGKLVEGKKTVHIPIQGPSMYPTLAWCSDYGGPENCAEEANRNSRRIVPEFIARGNDYVPTNGEIVSLQDGSKGIVKRVAGVPGDVLRIDGGYLYRNGTKVEEPYVWKSGSTYGDLNWLIPCKEVTVPSGSIFVLGDNRLMSSDSRETGFFKVENVHAYLPNGYQSDLSLDGFPVQSQQVSPVDYVALVLLINEMRKEAGLLPVSLFEGLNKIAFSLGKEVVSYDFDTDAFTASGGMSDLGARASKLGLVGYLNSSFMPGVYDLPDYKYLFTEDGGLKDFIMSSKLVKIGIAASDFSTKGGCHSPMTVLVGLEQ